MITQVNKYTWVVGKNKGIAQNRFTNAPQNGAEKIPTKKLVKENRTEEYRTFCQSAFQNRKFICVRAFRKMVKEQVHSNYSYYIQRMKDLGLITEKHNVIKPGDAL